nr:dormancy-associated protein 2-like [Setaria viridis]
MAKETAPAGAARGGPSQSFPRGGGQGQLVGRGLRYGGRDDYGGRGHLHNGGRGRRGGRRGRGYGGYNYDYNGQNYNYEGYRNGGAGYQGFHGNGDGSSKVPTAPPTMGGVLAGAMEAAASHMEEGAMDST